MTSTASAVCTLGDFLSLLLSSQANPESFFTEAPSASSIVTYGRDTAPPSFFLEEVESICPPIPTTDFSRLDYCPATEPQQPDAAQEDPPSGESELTVKLVCITGEEDQTFRFPLNPKVSGKQYDQAIRMGLKNALDEIAKKVQQKDKGDTQGFATSSCLVIYPKSAHVKEYASLLPAGFRADSFENSPVSPSGGSELRSFVDKFKDSALLLGSAWVLVNVILREVR